MSRKTILFLLIGVVYLILIVSGLTMVYSVGMPQPIDKPVITDPNATVAWSGTLDPEFKTDISFKTFLGRGSGESVQMLFRGDGFVVIQPQEEVYFQASGGQ
jgi:uncharacterized protein (AIM24 family)